MKKLSNPFLLFLLLAALGLSACGLRGQGQVGPQLTVEARSNQIRTEAAGTVLAELTLQSTRSITDTAVPSPTLASSATPQPPTATAAPSSTAAPALATSQSPVEYPTRTFTPAQTDYRCAIQEIEPDATKKITVDADFDVVVRVKNTGEVGWNPGKIFFVYTSGEKLQSRTSLVMLTSQVDVDGEYNFTVDMHAPDNPGTYKTTWAMLSGALYFCPVHFQVTVTKN